MKTPMNHPRQRWLAMAVGLFFVMCHAPAATAGTADTHGVYRLISVDGKPVPARVSHDGTTLEVRSGTFTIKADGTCGSRIIMVPPSGMEVIREVSATYVQDGPKLTMRWKGAGKTIGTITGDTFTMNNHGMVFVYRK
ncbi:MAG: hypothetical protein WC708_06085 [Lentisphaeria bacterium]